MTTVVALSAPLVLLLSGPAAATPSQEAAGVAVLKLSSDAWYSASAACTASPTGCVPAAAPASPYPPKTLHVGVAAGQEEARTYLSLGLDALPSGTALTGGLLTLPVAPTEDGSRMPESAEVRACLVTASFQDSVEGSTDAPPKLDCATTAPAKYVAAVGAAPAVLTVDLGDFVKAWAAGTPNQGIALVPAAAPASTSVWHVAFSAHDRTGSTVPAPSATVSYAAAGAPAAGGFSPPSLRAPAYEAPTSASSGVTVAAPLASTPLTAQAPLVQAPAVQPAVAPQAAPAAPPQQFTPQAFTGTGTFAYPGVFLLPLLFAAACGWLGRALTRDLSPL